MSTLHDMGDIWIMCYNSFPSRTFTIIVTTMEMAVDSSDGLLRHVLVGGFMSNSPNRNHGNESKQIENRRYPASAAHSTPSSSKTSCFGFKSPAFTLPTFSPLKRPNNKSTPVSCSTPSENSSSSAKVTPTAWVLPLRKHSNSCLSSSPSSSSPRRNGSSPVLNLAKIDETKVLRTHLETPEHNSNNPNFPETLITAATPEEKVSSIAEIHQSFECHRVKQFQVGSDFESISARLRHLSVASPSLESSPGLIVSSGAGNNKRYSKFRRSDITFGKFIGKGGFGCVHAGSILGSPVAVKIVQKRRGSGIHREILQAERLAFKLNLRHENIVGIYGVNLCEELRGDALILMELVTSRSLQALIDDITTDIQTKDRLGYAQQVASALDYLHENIVAHLDIKPANVLMTSDHVCKLSDFGSLTLTRPDVLQEEAEFTQLLGTLPYRAPELMTGLFPSTKADIYSFGIMLWQMLTRESPHKSANPHALIYQVVKWNIRPSIPETGNDVVETMYREMYTSCWSRDVDRRPNANEIIATIGTIMQHVSP